MFETFPLIAQLIFLWSDLSFALLMLAFQTLGFEFRFANNRYVELVYETERTVSGG